MGVGIVSARLTSVVVQASDLDASSAFYARTFGFEPFHRDATSCFLRTGASHLVLIQVGVPTVNLCLDLTVPDLDAAAESLRAAGVEFQRSPQMLVLHDPDGTLVELVEG